jgi:LDH2 family malate/lactate/ureidoglycolate dehydrogenase
MRIDAFRPAADFKSNMDLWLNRFRNATPAKGHEQVYVAGDIERSMEKVRMHNGIPLVQTVQHDLIALAEKMNLSFELKQ